MVLKITPIFQCDMFKLCFPVLDNKLTMLFYIDTTYYLYKFKKYDASTFVLLDRNMTGD